MCKNSVVVGGWINCFAVLVLVAALIAPWYIIARYPSDCSDAIIYQHWTEFWSDCGDSDDNCTLLIPCTDYSSSTSDMKRTDWDEYDDGSKVKTVYTLVLIAVAISIFFGLVTTIMICVRGTRDSINESFKTCTILASILTHIFIIAAFCGFLAVTSQYDKADFLCSYPDGRSDGHCDSFVGSQHDIYWGPGPGWIIAIISLLFLSIGCWMGTDEVFM